MLKIVCSTSLSFCFMSYMKIDILEIRKYYGLKCKKRPVVYLCLKMLNSTQVSYFILRKCTQNFYLIL